MYAHDLHACYIRAYTHTQSLSLSHAHSACLMHATNVQAIAFGANTIAYSLYVNNACMHEKRMHE